LELNRTALAVMFVLFGSFSGRVLFLHSIFCLSLHPISNANTSCRERNSETVSIDEVGLITCKLCLVMQTINIGDSGSYSFPTKSSHVAAAVA